jgi:hypothetical protein
MRSAALAACLVLAACATDGYGNGGTILPPARFDHPNDTMRVAFGSPEEVARLCGNIRIVACAVRHESGEGMCLVILRTGTPIGGAVWRHERGHCNGWPAHHPA